MKKKRITAILAAATLVLGLTACGSGNKSADNTSAKKDEEVTIGVYSGDWKTQIDEAALQDFEKETGIKVNIVEGADAEWVSKVEAADGKNVPYDILVLMPNSIRELNEKGLIENLDSDKVSNIADLYPSLLKEFENEDGTYLETAKGVISKILDAQTPEVDVMSGATFSSTGLKDAVADALQKAGN